MGQVDRFSETAAVHLGVGDQEDQGHQGEKHGHGGGDDGRQFPEDAGQQRRTRNGFQQRQPDPKSPGCSAQASQMEELEILLDNQLRPCRIHEFQEA